MKRYLRTADGRPVNVGDLLTSFRGDRWVVTGWPTNGRNRVYVRHAEDDPKRHADLEFFPQVFDLTWNTELD